MKSLLDSLTPEQQLQFLSAQDKDGKTVVQLAPADVRKDMEKMLKKYKREAHFEVNYGKLARFPHLAGPLGTKGDIKKIISFHSTTINSRSSAGFQVIIVDIMLL